MQPTQFRGWGLLGLGAIVCLGCSDVAQIQTFPVTGTVTRNGAPVEGAAVGFVPEGDGQAATGITDASGKYMLTTKKKDDGAVPGKYKVTIAKYEGKNETADSGKIHADYDISNEYPAGYNPDAADTAPSKNTLPARYSDPATSGFQAEVTEGENTHNFEIKS